MAGPCLIDVYWRRGWLSSGCFVVAHGVARDLVVASDGECQSPDRRIEALQRLRVVKATLSPAQLKLVSAFVVEDLAPDAKANGVRYGLRDLQSALHRLRMIYVEDGTE